MIAKLYRSVIPLALRTKIYHQFLGRVVFFFRHLNVIVRSKFMYLFQSFLPKTESNAALAFIGKYGITSYPAEYSRKYLNLPVQVHHDQVLKLPFVIHGEHKLYFPAFFSDEKVIRDYRALKTEQDPESAHRYVRSLDELKDRTLLDVGAAEGIFALDTIHLTQHVVLFEYQDYWQAPLRATFEPWRDKVEIVPKFVGARSDSALWVSLDDFLEPNGSDPLFIKMDIEGGERDALAGASRVLGEPRDIQVSVCTYHRPHDPEFIEQLLQKNNFMTEFALGVMYWQKRVSRGVIRGKKGNSLGV